MKLKKGHGDMTTWIAGSLLTIGIALIVAGEFIHAKGLSDVILRTSVTLGTALVISSLITLFID